MASDHAALAQPLVSVIIPTFNRAGLLNECIASVREQDYENVEIIVVDDGSTDNTEQVVRDHACQDNRVKYFSQSNAGAPKARNVGIKVSRGEYIKFLDSDDLIGETCVREQVFLYNKEAIRPDEIVVGRHDVVDLNGRIIRRIYPVSGVASSGVFYLENIIVKNPPTSAPLYPKEALRLIGGFDTRLPVLQDYDLVFRLALGGFSFRYFPMLAYRMRRHNVDGRISSVSNRLQASRHDEVMQKHRCMLLAKFEGDVPPEVRRAIFVRATAIERKLIASGFGRNLIGAYRNAMQPPSKVCLRGLKNLVIGATQFSQRRIFKSLKIRKR